jgi:hypothetical protein
MLIGLQFHQFSRASPSALSARGELFRSLHRIDTASLNFILIMGI